MDAQSFATTLATTSMKKSFSIYGPKGSSSSALADDGQTAHIRNLAALGIREEAARKGAALLAGSQSSQGYCRVVPASKSKVKASKKKVVAVVAVDEARKPQLADRGDVSSIVPTEIPTTPTVPSKVMSAADRRMEFDRLRIERMKQTTGPRQPKGKHGMIRMSPESLTVLMEKERSARQLVAGASSPPLTARGHDGEMEGEPIQVGDVVSTKGGHDEHGPWRHMGHGIVVYIEPPGVRRGFVEVEYSQSGAEGMSYNENNCFKIKAKNLKVLGSVDVRSSSSVSDTTPKKSSKKSKQARRPASAPALRVAERPDPTLPASLRPRSQTDDRSMYRSKTSSGVTLAPKRPSSAPAGRSPVTIAGTPQACQAHLTHGGSINVSTMQRQVSARSSSPEPAGRIPSSDGTPVQRSSGTSMQKQVSAPVLVPGSTDMVSPPTEIPTRTMTALSRPSSAPNARPASAGPPARKNSFSSMPRQLSAPASAPEPVAMTSCLGAWAPESADMVSPPAGTPAQRNNALSRPSSAPIARPSSAPIARPISPPGGRMQQGAWANAQLQIQGATSPSNRMQPGPLRPRQSDQVLAHQIVDHMPEYVVPRQQVIRPASAPTRRPDSPPQAVPVKPERPSSATSRLKAARASVQNVVSAAEAWLHVKPMRFEEGGV